MLRILNTTAERPTVHRSLRSQLAALNSEWGVNVPHMVTAISDRAQARLSNSDLDVSRSKMWSIRASSRPGPRKPLSRSVEGHRAVDKPPDFNSTMRLSVWNGGVRIRRGFWPHMYFMSSSIDD